MPRGKIKAPEGGGGLIHLDPSSILATENSRFGLKDSRIESLAADIADKGGVMLPVEVESEGDKGYRLVSGFYRLAAVQLLNKQGAGLTLPALLVSTASPLERLRRQLSENMERENQSPMDRATAIKKLFDAGVSRMDVRNIFSAPGGRKGLRVQPASNSHINMTLSFLDLPKPIQAKIHDGSVGVAAAHELVKTAPEKRDEVLAKAEKERELAIAREEKEEESFLARERKGQEAVEKVKTAETELSKARDTLTQAEETHAAKVDAEATAYKAKASLSPKSAPKKTKEKLDEQFRAASLETKGAERAVEVARKAVTKNETRIAKTSETVAAATERLRKAREAKGKKPVSPGAVKKAAKETGGKDTVNLSASEIRSVVHELSLPGGPPKTRAIGVSCLKCFKGEITDTQLYRELKQIVGDGKSK